MSNQIDPKADLDEQAKWGEGRWDRVARRLLARIEQLETDRDTARDAIVALRQRVKALEDKTP
jgi:hypothetical protein